MAFADTLTPGRKSLINDIAIPAPSTAGAAGTEAPELAGVPTMVLPAAAVLPVVGVAGAGVIGHDIDAEVYEECCQQGWLKANLVMRNEGKAT